MIRLLFLCLMLAAPAAAQTYDVDRDFVLACFDAMAGDGDAPDCIGAAAEHCMERSQGGYSTAGMGACAAAETAIWDEMLNQVYGDLRADMRAIDIDAGPDALSRADALRDAQRAWIAFRDADCVFSWTMFQEGTMRSLISAGCMLDMTAARALELHAHLELPQ